ncbi:MULTISPECIES: LytR C-terminal domain-containing protein [unclassified Kribbella]|uniref:LytR C-terminal domain-containing protein n=1 Tax=unclassified Kribbella TaxID=2644121 RepID=UPI00301A90BB
MTAIHPQPRPHSRIHWRTPITMVILLGLLVGGAWWGWNSLINSSAEPTCVEQKLPNNRLVPKQVVLNVYNGGAKAGSAARVAEVLEKRGFNINKVANEPKGDKIDVVSVRGATDNAPELLLVAGQLNQKALTVGDGRTDHTVDLVIGAGFGSLKLKGLPSVTVPPDSTVCLPVIHTPQPIPSGQNPN